MKPCEARALLHNMSAPPRAVITFRPVQPARDQPEPAVQLEPSGLRWCCRVDILNHFWPLEPGVGRDPAEGIDWHRTREPERHLLAHAIAEERGWVRPDETLASEVDAMPAEAVFDMLRGVAQRVDMDALALPRIGLLIPGILTRIRVGTTSMRKTVAILARRRGSVFGRHFDPLPLADVTQVLDLWEPASLNMGGDR